MNCPLCVEPMEYFTLKQMNRFAGVNYTCPLCGYEITWDKKSNYVDTKQNPMHDIGMVLLGGSSPESCGFIGEMHDQRTVEEILQMNYKNLSLSFKAFKKWLLNTPSIEVCGPHSVKIKEQIDELIMLLKEYKNNGKGWKESEESYVEEVFKS